MISHLSLDDSNSPIHSPWIWIPGGGEGENLYAFFRREFSTTPGGLSLRVTADSFFWLYLDGKLLGRGPARSFLSAYAYDEFAAALLPGNHCLAVIGHHIGKVNATVMTGRPGIWLDAIFAGKEQRIDLGSGPGWRCLKARAWKRNLPDLMSHFGFWEERDERLIPAGWMLPGFDDAEWVEPEIIGESPCNPWTALVPRDIPLPEIRLFEPSGRTRTGSWWIGEQSDFPSKTVATRLRMVCSVPASLPWSGRGQRDGSWTVFDFTRCLSGYAELHFSSSTPGQVLEISYDDLLTKEGFINPERSYAHLSDRYILPGGRCTIRTMHPRGFRFLMLDVNHSGPFVLESILAIDETYPFQLRDADFGDPWLNKIYAKSAETLRVCTTDAFTDCASRERVQWTQDLYLANRVAFYAFGDTAMMRRTIFQAANSSLPDGRINGFYPSERSNCAFASSSLLWLHQIVDYWEFTHDKDAEQLLPTAQRLLEFIQSIADDAGLVTSWPAGQFWDWAPLEDTGCLLITNAVWIRAVQRLREHEIFRRGLSLLAHVPKAENLKIEAHRRFWVPDRRLYRNAGVPTVGSDIFSQQANTMAIWSGICPREEIPALVQRITDPGNLGPVPVGEQLLDPANPPSPEKIVPFGTLWFAHFFCEALFEAGLQETALEQIRHHWQPYDDLPNYPETRIQHGNTTLCHAWAAGPAYLLPRFLSSHTNPASKS